MFTQFTALLTILSILWFLVYWIFGGVVFSIISLIRPGKMKRVRFSCLYTLLSIGTGYGAAYLGVRWASDATGGVPSVSSVSEAVLVLGGLGFVGILLGLMCGFLVSFLGGWIIMAISRSREPSWFDRMQNPPER